MDFTHRASAAYPEGARLGDVVPSVARQARAPTNSFANVVFASTATRFVGGLAGGFIAAGVDDRDGLDNLLQGIMLGAWVGGAAGGASASGRPVAAFFGSTVGLVPAVETLDSSYGLLLGPLMHGLVIALFTTALEPVGSGRTAP